MPSPRIPLVPCALGLLFAAAGSARADRPRARPAPVAADPWSGSWEVTTRVSYATCDGVAHGSTAHASFRIAVRGDAVALDELTEPGRQRHSHILVARHGDGSAAVLQFRDRDQDCEVGLSLGSPAANRMTGLRVTARRTPDGPCAIVYELTGTRITDARGRRIAAEVSEAEMCARAADHLLAIMKRELDSMFEGMTPEQAERARAEVEQQLTRESIEAECRKKHLTRAQYDCVLRAASMKDLNQCE